MKKNGFTLLEITVSTLIIGLLISLASLAVMKGIQGAKIKQAKIELELISTAVLQLAWDTGKWPNGQLRTQGGSVEMWDISLDRCGLMGTDGNYNNWKGPYYGGATLDPWGNPYFFDPDYSYKGKVRVFVGSFGPNGVGRNLYDSDDVLPKNALRD